MGILVGCSGIIGFRICLLRNVATQPFHYVTAVWNPERALNEIMFHIVFLRPEYEKNTTCATGKLRQCDLQKEQLDRDTCR